MSVLTRRQFLRSTGQAGLALTLATAFPPAAQVAYAHNSYALVPSENGGYSWPQCLDHQTPVTQS